MHVFDLTHKKERWEKEENYFTLEIFSIFIDIYGYMKKKNEKIPLRSKTNLSL